MKKQSAVSEALRSLIKELAKDEQFVTAETKNGMKTLKDMGISFQNEDGTYKTLFDIFEEAANKVN